MGTRHRILAWNQNNSGRQNGKRQSVLSQKGPRSNVQLLEMLKKKKKIRIIVLRTFTVAMSIAIRPTDKSTFP